MKHPFHLKAVWNGGRNSEGHINAGGLKTISTTSSDPKNGIEHGTIT